MTTFQHPYFAADLRHELTAMRANWGWLVALGIALVVLGMFALSAVVIASFATTIAIGVLILLSGIAETFGAFWSRGWSGFFLHLLSGVLSMVVGVFFLRIPVGGLLALTLLLSCLLMVGGIFKIVTALTYRFASWGWPVAGGIIDVILGTLIWLGWPATALWVIGLFVGITLIFRGVNWMMLGFAIRALPRAGLSPR